MTVGELAKMFNGEGWLGENLKADLTIIKVLNWNRNQYFDECELNWIKPSPNMVNLNAAILYPGLCLIEGTNVSEGRGTMNPFLWIGAPFIDSKDLIQELESYKIPGVKFSSITFTPISIPNMSASPKFMNEECYGISITITDRDKLDAVKLGVAIVYALNKLFKDKFEINLRRFNLLVGDAKIAEMILLGENPKAIFDYWKDELNQFKEMRKKYLLYK